MLAIPTKKGKSTDWGVPLREYIAQAYGEKVADEQTESLAKLNQAREWVLSNNKKSDESSIENIKAYLRMLGAVEARFPVKESYINITFTWYDSFKPAKKFMHHRLEDERAAILYNYASMESYLGMVQDRGTPDGMQAALTHFTHAARYFGYLRDVFLKKVDGPRTSDLSEEGLTMLVNLMMAQTQACTFEKAIKKKVSPGALSKIAAGAQQLYQNALNAAQSPLLSQVIDKSWATHMKFQLGCFAASSAFYFSKTVFAKFNETGEGFGDGIAYLKLAVAKCDQVLSTAAAEGLAESQVATIEGLKTSVAKDLAKATEDNNSIYLQPVPELSALPALAAHVLVKLDLDKVDPSLVGPILPGMNLEDQSGAELFQNLLPAEIQIAVAMFKSKVSDLTERLQKIVTNGEKSVKEALQGANLPASIEAAGGSRGLPDDTWARILEVVQSNGGVNGLKSTLIQNGKLGEQLSAVLYDCQMKLAADEANDTRNRQIWGNRWTLPPAAQANSLVKKDWAKYKGFIAEASSSDKKLLATIEDLKDVLADLSKPKADLDALMPDPGVIDDDMHVEGLRSKLRMSFINLQTHLQQVNSKLAAFEYSASKMSIVADLFKGGASAQELAANESAVSEIIEEKVQELEAPFAEVKALAENDSTMLNRVLTDNSNYLAARRENAATKERESALSRLEKGIEQFQNLHKHVDEGKKFYVKLTENVNKLQVLVNDHCLSRDLLAKELEQNLTRALDQNTYNSPQQQFPSAPVMTPYTGQQYSNPQWPHHQQGQGFPQPQRVAQPRPELPDTMVNGQNLNHQYNHPQPTPAPAPYQPPQSTAQPVQQNNELSLYEQMKRAQLAAEQNGTLSQFADIPSSGPPASNAQSDMDAAQTALALEQEEILNQIKMQQAIKESKRTDYSPELQQVKDLFGSQYPDKLIMDHLKATGGNVTVTIQNLMDNVPVKKKKKGMFAGMFGGKKENKPAPGSHVQPNSGGGGDFRW